MTMAMRTALKSVVSWVDKHQRPTHLRAIITILRPQTTMLTLVQVEQQVRETRVKMAEITSKMTIQTTKMAVR